MNKKPNNNNYSLSNKIYITKKKTLIKCRPLTKKEISKSKATITYPKSSHPLIWHLPDSCLIMGMAMEADNKDLTRVILMALPLWSLRGGVEKTFNYPK